MLFSTRGPFEQFIVVSDVDLRWSSSSTDVEEVLGKNKLYFERTDDLMICPS